MTKEHHPVWTVYDRLRTARLNAKYFACRLQTFERWSMGFDMVLAATTSSAFAGLVIWQTEAGKLLWQGLGGAAAVIAIIRPPLGLTRRIKAYESLLNGYRTLDYDLMEIKAAIEQKGKYDAALQGEFKKAARRERDLIAKNPESRDNAKLKAQCVAEVLRELPVESFFVPEE